MSVLIVMLASVALYGVPGGLLYPLLRRRGFDLITSIGIGISGLTVLYATLASLFGYVFWLQLAATGIVLIALGLANYRRSRAEPGYWNNLRPRLQRWQWLLLALIGLVYLTPAFLINVPFDTDAQGFGLLLVTVRLSGSITTLAPFQPDVGWFYSPGYFLFGAQLSDLTGAPADDVMLGLSHLLALGVIAGIGALGKRLGDSAHGWWAATAAAGGFALFTTLMDSAYTNVFGLWLTATFLWLLVHALEDDRRLNVLLAGLALASIVLGHPDSIIHLLMAYLLFYGTAWFMRPRPTRVQYLRLGVIIPLLGILICLPWLLRTLPLVSQIEVHERQHPQFGHLYWLFDINGRWVPLLALVGIWWAVRKRHLLDIWSLTWLPPIIEVSSLGTLDALSRRTALDPMQIFYPYGVAWHATIIPLALLAARALTPLSEWLARFRWSRPLRTGGLALALLAALAGVLLHQPIVAAVRGSVRITGAVASPADEAVYAWLRANTPADARLLNYPGRYEGQWAPVLAERDAVYVRDQLFYVGARALRAEQAVVAQAYLDPASPDAYDQLRASGIDYVVVPQALNRPGLWENQLRWRPPALVAQRSSFEAASYLELLVDIDGAQVWQVKEE